VSEDDLKIVRELFDKAKENFERDGYLAPGLLAWAPDRPPTISNADDHLHEPGLILEHPSEGLASIESRSDLTSFRLSSSPEL